MLELNRLLMAKFTESNILVTNEAIETKRKDLKIKGTWFYRQSTETDKSRASGI